MSVQKIADEFIKRKDETTFLKLTKRLYPGLNHYLYPYIQDKETRENIIQNTYTNLWTKIDQYNKEFAFSTWAYRIARNEALLNKRICSKKVSIETPFSAVDNTTYINETSYVPDYEYFSSDTENDLENLYNFILSQMNHLDEKYKDVIILREVNKMKYKDIAEKLDVNIRTVKTRVRLARTQLANLCKEKFPHITNRYYGS